MLGTRQLGILIQGEVLGPADLSRLPEYGNGFLLNLTERLALNPWGHGAKYCNPMRASQWYESTLLSAPAYISLFLFPALR
jgi:hypothetical protein